MTESIQLEVHRIKMRFDKVLANRHTLLNIFMLNKLRKLKQKVTKYDWGNMQIISNK